MIANPGFRNGIASDAYAKTNPLHRIVNISDPSFVRVGVALVEDEKLGALMIDPPCETAMEKELPFAYHEMRQRASDLVIHTIRVGKDTVYVVVATHEADNKLLIFVEHWEKVLSSCSNDPAFLGCWALGFQLCWAFTKESAERIRTEAFI